MAIGLNDRKQFSKLGLSKILLIKGGESSRCENSFDKFRGGENKRRVNMNGRAEFFYSMIIEI